MAAQGHSSWCILPGGRGNTRCPQAEQRGWEQTCWEQGHPYTRNLYGYTVTIVHRRKVLPTGTHSEDPSTFMGGGLSRGMLAQRACGVGGCSHCGTQKAQGWDPIPGTTHITSRRDSQGQRGAKELRVVRTHKQPLQPHGCPRTCHSADSRIPACGHTSQARAPVQTSLGARKPLGAVLTPASSTHYTRRHTRDPSHIPPTASCTRTVPRRAVGTHRSLLAAMDGTLWAHSLRARPLGLPLAAPRRAPSAAPRTKEPRGTHRRSVPRGMLLGTALRAVPWQSTVVPLQAQSGGQAAARPRHSAANARSQAAARSPAGTPAAPPGVGAAPGGTAMAAGS